MRKSYMNNVHYITGNIMYLEGIKIRFNTHLNTDQTYFQHWHRPLFIILDFNHRPHHQCLNAHHGHLHSARVRVLHCCMFDHYSLHTRWNSVHPPVFLQPHETPQPSALHPQDIILSKDYGAMGRSESIGVSISSSFHPQSVGCKYLPIHSCTVRYVSALTLSGLNLPLSSSSTTSHELLSQVPTCSG